MKIKITENIRNVRDGIILFFVQIFAYGFVAINYRAIAQANYPYTILTDVIIALIQFLVIRKISKAKSATIQLIGFIAGSVVGSVLGIYISKIILGA